MAVRGLQPRTPSIDVAASAADAPKAALSSPDGMRADGLSLEIDRAWREHFHAPEAAVQAVAAWRLQANQPAPNDETFALIVEFAGLVRTEPLPLIEERIGQLKKKLAVLPASAGKRRLTALTSAMAAVFAWRRRDFEDALSLFGAALDQADALDAGDVHFVLHWRAITLLGTGRPELAFRDSLAAREYFRDKDAATFALLSFNVGVMLTHAGDWDAAETALRDAFALANLVRVQSFESMARSNLAYCLINTGQFDEARMQMTHVLNHDRDGFMRLKPGDVLTTIAENLVATGYLDEAADYTERSLADARERGFALGIGTGLWNAGRIAALRGEPRQAARCLGEALLVLRRFPQQTQLWKSALAVAQMYAQLGDFRRAFRWHTRFHAVYMRWQVTTRDVRLAYAQALLEIDAVKAQRDAAEAERARLAAAMQELEVLNTELRRRVDQVESLQAELHEQAIRDPLTGLLNRRGLHGALKRMIEESHRLGHVACVAMLDLDRFKRVNDGYGHALGDRILAQAGEVLLDCFRKTDIAFRFGGDEFCVLLPGADRLVAEERMTNFSTQLAAALRHVAPDLPFDVTASVGIAVFPDDGSDTQALLDAADAALYRSKRGDESH